jgi:hypothetical protein
LGNDAVYVITRGPWIVGDSRLFIGNNPKGISVVDLCMEVDRFDGGNTGMRTYTPVDADGYDVYAVYRTDGIPLQTKGFHPAAVDLVKANGTLVGYVRRVTAPWDLG